MLAARREAAQPGSWLRAQAMTMAGEERRAALAEATRISVEVAACPEVAALQFRDLRRTIVVWLGRAGMEDSAIAGITGHAIDYCKKILETYMPRDTQRNDATILDLEKYLAGVRDKAARASA